MGGIYAESLRGPRHADGSFNLTQGGTHRFARGFAQAAMPPARRGGDSASGRVGRGDVGERCRTSARAGGWPSATDPVALPPRHCLPS
jgi:hypothetical protein